MEILVSRLWQCLAFFTQPCRTWQTFPTKVVAVNCKAYACHNCLRLTCCNARIIFLILHISTPVIICSRVYLSQIALSKIKNILDESLLRYLNKSTADISLIRNIADTISERHGNIAVEQLLKRFYITEGTLERLFNKAVGINPKLYLQ